MIETGQPAADLASDESQRWTTAEMTADFQVEGAARTRSTENGTA